MNVPEWFRLDAIVRNGILRLVAEKGKFVEKVSKDLSLTIIHTEVGPVRVYLRQSGKRAGHLACSSCTNTKTEEDPCKHIGAALFFHGLLRPPRFEVNDENTGNQLPRHLKTTFDLVRFPWMFNILASVLAAIPESVTKGYRTGRGRHAVPIGAVAYASLLWAYRGVTRMTALEELSNTFHRDVIQRHFNYAWPAEQHNAHLGRLLPRVPFREYTLWWFLSHRSSAFYLDLAMGLCAVAMREFEDVSGWDGTGEQLFIFCMYAEDRMRLLRRNERNQRLATKQRRQGKEHEAQLINAIEDELSMTEEEVAKVFGKEAAEADKKGMRRRLYLKAIVGTCHRSGVVFGVFMAKPGGEQPYSIPMVIRAFETIATKFNITDAGHVKHLRSLVGKRIGVEQFAPAMANETLEGGSEGKSARKAELERQANPEYFAQMQGMRSKQESANHTKDRIIGPSLRCRGPCIRRRDRPKDRKGQKTHTEKHRRKLTKLDFIRMENEVRIHNLTLNGYWMARWRVKLMAENKALDDGGHDPRRYILWDSDLNPNFLACAQIMPPEAFTDSDALVRDFSGNDSHVEAAINKRFPHGFKGPERLPKMPGLLETPPPRAKAS